MRLIRVPVEPAQHDNGKAVSRHKASPTIGGAEIGPLLQLHNMIEIERADTEIIAVFPPLKRSMKRLGERNNVDGDTIDGEIAMVRSLHVHVSIS